MVALVASGPYIGFNVQELKAENPFELLDQAKRKLDEVTESRDAKTFLEQQIQKLQENSRDRIKEVPNYPWLSRGEDFLKANLDFDENQNLLDAIGLIKKAFAAQRYQFQTKEITKDEQRNFAKILNRRIDPINQKGNRAKDKKDDEKFAPFQTTLSSLATDILRVPVVIFTQAKDRLEKMNKEFNKNFDIKTYASQLYRMLHTESGDLLKRLLSSIPPGAPPIMSQAFASISGGLENAVSLHLAFTKVAFAKLKEKIPDIRSPQFKLAWNNVIKNLAHISKQFSSVQGWTLTLVENLNGNKSNQIECYEFNPDNFELDDDGQNLTLLPTLDFLQTVIRKANDNTTQVESATPIRPSQTVANFAEEYTSPVGCPIHNVSGNLNGESFSLAERYFESIEILTQATFGLAN